MMGKKKLSEIRAELSLIFARSGVDAAWFVEQVRKLEDGPEVDAREKETLLLLRNALADARREATRQRRGRKTTRSR